jgi:tellurite resistance protein
MEISYPNREELTEEEQLELDNLRAIVEQAVADGIITKGERDRMYQAIWADGKVTCQELGLLRTMIRDKIYTGELRLDYS